MSDKLNDADLAAAIQAECTGSRVWRVADPEGAYCIEFDRHNSINPERDCRDWFAEQKRKFPGWAEENQYQVIEARWFSAAEQLARLAADEITRLSAALSEALAQLEAERARGAALQPALFRYVLVSRPGWAAVRKGPLADGKHVEQMLRELYALHPDATCLVINAPDASYPDDGREWIAMFGDQRRKKIPPAPPLAIIPGDKK